MQKFYYHKLGVKHWQRKIDFWFYFVVLGIVYGLLRYYFVSPDLPGRTFGQFLHDVTLPFTYIYVTVITVYFLFTLGSVLLLSANCRPLYSCFIAWAITIDYISQKLVKQYIETSNRLVIIQSQSLYIPQSGSIIFSCSGGMTGQYAMQSNIYKEGSLFYMIREALDKHGM